MVRAVWLVFLLWLYALFADESDKPSQQVQLALENSKGDITSYVTQLRLLQTMLAISQPSVGHQLALLLQHMEVLHQYEKVPHRHIEMKFEDGAKVTYTVSTPLWLRMYRNAHLFQPLHLPPFRSSLSSDSYFHPSFQSEISSSSSSSSETSSDSSETSFSESDSDFVPDSLESTTAPCDSSLADSSSDSVVESPLDSSHSSSSSSSGSLAHSSSSSSPSSSDASLASSDSQSSSDPPSHCSTDSDTSPASLAHSTAVPDSVSHFASSHTSDSASQLSSDSSTDFPSAPPSSDCASHMAASPHSDSSADSSDSPPHSSLDSSRSDSASPSYSDSSDSTSYSSLDPSESALGSTSNSFDPDASSSSSLFQVDSGRLREGGNEQLVQGEETPGVESILERGDTQEALQRTMNGDEGILPEAPRTEGNQQSETDVDEKEAESSLLEGLWRAQPEIASSSIHPFPSPLASSSSLRPPPLLAPSPLPLFSSNSKGVASSPPDPQSALEVSAPDAFSEASILTTSTSSSDSSSSPISDSISYSVESSSASSVTSSSSSESPDIASPISSAIDADVPTSFSVLNTSVASVPLDENSMEGRRQAVVKEFLHAWEAYERYAWGQDELNPVSKRGSHSYNMSLLMVDSLDSLLIMGLHAQFNRSRDYLLSHLNFTHQKGVNLFETTIRVLGGLLSAYALSGDARLLGLAETLADRMLFAFDTPTGLPVGTLDLEWQNGSNPAWIGGKSTTAEVGSVQLEFQYLSFVTGNASFAARVNRVSQHLESLNRALYTQYIDPSDGSLTATTITVGARVDSLYEYFLKQHLMWPKAEEGVRGLRMYHKSIQAMLDVLLDYSQRDNLAYIAERATNDVNIGKMDHLVCFVPGMLALGACTFLDENISAWHLEIAAELMKTCVEFYTSPTGLSPEIVQFMSHSSYDLYVDPGSAHSLLRPETVESLFVLWRITHKPIYREWGWQIFIAMRKWARVCQGGYSGLRDVRVTTGKQDCGELAKCGDCFWENWNDHMESFFLAETLKYLYLLFSEDDVISLDNFVFNTEAHPLPKPAVNSYRRPQDDS